MTLKTFICCNFFILKNALLIIVPGLAMPLRLFSDFANYYSEIYQPCFSSDFVLFDETCVDHECTLGDI